jgi:hypothetical protein
LLDLPPEALKAETIRPVFDVGFVQQMAADSQYAADVAPVPVGLQIF